MLSKPTESVTGHCVHWRTCRESQIQVDMEVWFKECIWISLFATSDLLFRSRRGMSLWQTVQSTEALKDWRYKKSHHQHTSLKEGMGSAKGCWLYQYPQAPVQDVKKWIRKPAYLLIQGGGLGEKKLGDNMAILKQHVFCLALENIRYWWENVWKDLASINHSGGVIAFLSSAESNHNASYTLEVRVVGLFESDYSMLYQWGTYYVATFIEGKTEIQCIHSISSQLPPKQIQLIFS
jgi:hypothetical protein